MAEDREALAALTETLGAPVPPGATEEPRTLDDTRVRLPDLPLFGGVRRSALAHRGQLHTVELSFPGACLPACVGRVRAALDDWLGPPSPAREGNAFFFHYAWDTTRVTFEHYPRKPAFSRLVLSCEPLAAFARGRPEGLRPRRRGAAAGPLPRCRPVPTRANSSR